MEYYFQLKKDYVLYKPKTIFLAKFRNKTLCKLASVDKLSSSYQRAWPVIFLKVNPSTKLDTVSIGRMTLKYLLGRILMFSDITEVSIHYVFNDKK